MLQCYLTVSEYDKIHSVAPGKNVRVPAYLRDTAGSVPELELDLIP